MPTIIWLSGAESIAEDLVFVDLLGNAETPPLFASLTGIVAAAICGAFGNRWYLSHARKVISSVRAQGLDEPATLAALSHRGGTSLVSVLLFAVLFFAGSIVAILLLDLLFYQP